MGPCDLRCRTYKYMGLMCPALGIVVYIHYTQLIHYTCTEVVPLLISLPLVVFAVGDRLNMHFIIVFLHLRFAFFCDVLLNVFGSNAN